MAQKTSTSIHLYTSRPDYISQRSLLTHTHKNKALASDTTKSKPASHQLKAGCCCDSWQTGLVKVASYKLTAVATPGKQGS